MNIMQISDACTGCGLCEAICPVTAIRMSPDRHGFLRPSIQENMCINCGACAKSCPVMQAPQNRHSEPAETLAYSVHHRDDAVRMASTSGGAFTALCEWVFQHNGVVFGAAYDDSFQVVHIRSDDMAALGKLRTAKYAQSIIGNSFQEVRRLLTEGTYVLFSGTPCQIAGLSAFLGKEYEKLILVDMICHGVPSPAVWQEYIRYRSRTDAQGNKPTAINLRSKKTGWPGYSVHFEYENGAEYSAKNSEDPFMRAFVGNLCLRPSCYHCNFKGLNRSSDFTLGDYWGVWNQAPEFNDGLGTSLVLVHSQKAKTMWGAIAEKFRYKQVDAIASLAENPSALQSSEKPANREAFLENYADQDFRQLVDSLRPIPAKHKLSVWKRIIRRFSCLFQGRGKSLPR